jgi:tetratricopeptide (TPR) repeat protein
MTNPALRSARRLGPCWVGPLVLGATLAAYFPALRGGPVWDDDFHITKAALRSGHGLARIWFDLGATAQYYPVLHTAFWIEHHLWGETMLGYHLTNVFLHATSACLFIVALRRLRVPGALVGGLLFALHPVGVESVAWISEQKNTLSTVFYLLAALAYLRWRESLDGESVVGTGGPPVRAAAESIAGTDGPAARPHLYYVGLGFFLLALLSKSVTATLPAALLVVAWWQRGRLSARRDVVPLLPWFALGAAAGLFTAWVERRYIGAQGAEFALTAADRILIAGRVLWFYLGKLVWPARLIFIYPHWTITASDPGAYLYPAGTLAVLGLLWAIRRRTRAPLACALFFAGSLFPALGFFNVYPFLFSYVADHFQYLASLGIYAGAAGAWGRWATCGRAEPGSPALLPAGSRAPSGGAKAIDPTRRPGAIGVGPAVVAAGVLLVLGALTWRQSRHYRDARTLYEETLAQNPACWLADTNLGILLVDSGQPSAALVPFQRALALKPDLAETHLDLGNALRALGRNPEAMVQYDLALRGRADYAPAHYNKGVALAAAGRPREAIPEYREALRLNPGYAEAHDNLGNALRDIGRLTDALPEYAAALQLDPTAPEFHNNLGIALAEAGRLPEAVAELNEALRLRPRYAEAEDNLGIAIAHLGRTAEALRHLRAAAAIAPDRLEARYDLAMFLAQGGRLAEAVAELRACVALRPDYPEGHNSLGKALGALGRLADAIAEYREAIRLRPDFREAHYDLALALRATGHPDEAAREFALARTAAGVP